MLGLGVNMIKSSAKLRERMLQILSEFPKNEVRKALHECSGNPNPVDCILWVPIDQVEANDYNPNAVAKNEMRLLHLSIKADGYTQPIVTIWDEEKQKYVIIDGFHRFTTC